MIVNDKEATARLASPINLINRLSKLNEDKSRKNAMSLFIRPSVDVSVTKPEEVKTTFNPFQPLAAKTPELIPANKESEAKLSDILDDHDSKIKLGLAHDSAIGLLTNSISALAAKLDDVKADKLPSVIAAASKTIESIRRERLEASKQNKDREVHYHFYTPEQKKLSEYEVIEVS